MTTPTATVLEARNSHLFPSERRKRGKEEEEEEEERTISKLVNLLGMVSFWHHGNVRRQDSAVRCSRDSTMA